MKTSFFAKTGTFLVSSLALFNWAHADGIQSENDPLARLGDLYAFVEPFCQATGGSGCEADPEELIVALTINPFADGAVQFSEDVIYHFYFENDSGARTQIDCSFSQDQVVTCSGMGELSVQARVGQEGISGDLRVFAGLRDNPAFIDLDAQERFLELGIAAYTNPGTDSLAGTNVLAIVLGIKTSAFASGSAPDHNLQKIWAASERVGGQGVNGGFSGSWYNPEQNGQGWNIEIIELPSGENGFLSFFYGYDDDGEQLWLITSGAIIEGNRVTADLYRTDAIGFGGNFDPGSFALGDAVGSVSFEFETCDEGTATFTSSDPVSLQDFTSPVLRLSSIDTLDCALLVGGQVDRVGRPFIRNFMPDDMRNDYESNSDPDSWNSAYRTALLNSLNMFAAADGNPAWNGFYSAEAWVDILVDDRLLIDLKKAQSVDFLSIELSQLVPQDWNDSAGRTLFYDVHETFFNVMITAFDPFIEDFLYENDVPFLIEFPFLAAPHQ